MADGDGAGLPAVQGLPAGVGGDRRLTACRRAVPDAVQAASICSDSQLDAVTRGCRILRLPWTIRLCQPSRAAAPERGRDLARAARPLPGLGLDLPRDRDRGRDDPAVPDGGDPVRCSPGSILLAWSIARERPIVRRADPTRVARQRHRRRAAARRRDGHGRLRRADDPVGHHGAAHRDDAGLGRDLRAGSSSASDCRGWPSSGSSSASSASRSSSARRSSGGTGALDPVGLAAVLISPIAWSTRLAVRLASGRAAAPAARRDRRPDARSAARSWRSWPG